MSLRIGWLRRQAVGALALVALLGIGWLVGAPFAPQTVPVAKSPLVRKPVALKAVAQDFAPPDRVFAQTVQPFLQKNCVRCHNDETSMAGVRVNQLGAGMEDRQIGVWEGVRHRVEAGTMPPKGQPQPSSAERQTITAWITQSLETARLRPGPKNGLVRRLTVAQYRNTLRDLLQLDDDLTEALPPDAISVDGFVNNKDTLQLSPLLLRVT